MERSPRVRAAVPVSYGPHDTVQLGMYLDTAGSTEIALEHYPVPVQTSSYRQKQFLMR
jgi:hypothetical protein